MLEHNKIVDLLGDFSIITCPPSDGFFCILRSYLDTDKSAHGTSHLVYTASDDEILRVGSLSYETHKNKVTVNYSEIADCIGSVS